MGLVRMLLMAALTVAAVLSVVWLALGLGVFGLALLVAILAFLGWVYARSERTKRGRRGLGWSTALFWLSIGAFLVALRPLFAF